MTTPTASLEAMRDSTTALLDGLTAEGWTDADMRAPSLLPDWTRGHVLTHIARNADGIRRTVDGAMRGEVLARYPQGRSGRDADIDAGAGRSAADVLADVRTSAEQLDATYSAVADADGWALLTEDLPVLGYTSRRRREIEIHRVDLAGGYAATQWPPDFVAHLLPKLAAELDARSAGALRVEVGATGTICDDLVGRVWTCGEGDTVDVVGPDWALLAWLVGRSETAAEALSATPELPAWS